MITADSIKIDTDEGRFIMVVDYIGSAQPLTFDIHDIALEVEAEVRRELRPYALEAEYARATMPSLVTNRPVDIEDAIEAGYALDDPKSPGYHDRVVD
jgi:hypothetical protein